MNDNNIDELFKSRIDDYEATPSDKVWKGVNSGITKAAFIVRYKKQLIAVVLLLLLGSSGYFLWNRGGSKKTVLQQTNTPLVKTMKKPTPVINSGESRPFKKRATTNGEWQKKSVDEHVTTDKHISHELDVKEKKETLAEQKQPVNLTEFKTPDNWTPNPSLFLLKHKSLMQLLYEKPELLPQPDFEKMENPYHNMRRTLHGWIGAAASVDMVYYPDSRDKVSYSACVELGLKSGKFYIVSGLSYRKQSEEGRYRIDFKSYDSVGYYNRVVSFEINPQNPEQITYKTVKATVYDSIVHINMVHPLFSYRYFNVPVSVGYKFFNKNGFSAAVETGMIFSNRLSSKIPDVEFNNSEYQLLSITRETPERRDINWQWTVSLRMRYEVKKGISFALQPTFTKYIQSIYSSGNPVMPYTMGIRMGLYYDF